MVRALLDGVKGGRWFSLWDKLITREALAESFARVKANGGAAGVDHTSIEAFARDLDAQLTRLHEALRAGTYRPSAVRRVYIPKPGRAERRALGIATVRDRVVQGALRATLEPIFEREFAEHSYGFRPGRSALQAVERVSALLSSGRVWAVEVDFASYFDTIPHAALMARVRTRVSDGSVLGLIEAMLSQPVSEEGTQRSTTAGVPQGSVVGPLLANAYLDPLDHEMARAGLEMTRYADDLVILCASEEEAQRALRLVHRWSRDAGLTVHPDKTRVVQVSEHEGIDFVGYHLRLSRRRPGQVARYPRAKSVGSLRASLRPLTRRTSGQSLGAIVGMLTVRLRGFFQHFRLSSWSSLRPIDGWVRHRLRSVLRRRRGGRGRGRGADHQRWTNAFFEDLGLFSLVRALEQTTHSPRG
jgi:RNA-directed DNA polymerase